MCVFYVVVVAWLHEGFKCLVLIIMLTILQLTCVLVVHYSAVHSIRCVLAYDEASTLHVHITCVLYTLGVPLKLVCPTTRIQVCMYVKTLGWYAHVWTHALVPLSCNV